jgi:hypothetical protein
MRRSASALEAPRCWSGHSPTPAGSALPQGYSETVSAGCDAALGLIKAGTRRGALQAEDSRQKPVTGEVPLLV